MAKLTNMPDLNALFNEAFIAAIPEIKIQVENQLNQNLNSNRKANGSQQPTKKDATKREYNKKGYDTMNWLKRSGKALGQGFSWVVDATSITVKPKDPDDVLKYHLKDAQGLFRLSSDTLNKVYNILNKKFKEKLK